MIFHAHSYFDVEEIKGIIKQVVETAIEQYELGYFIDDEFLSFLHSTQSFVHFLDVLVENASGSEEDYQ